jgi:hypothetical protein
LIGDWRKLHNEELNNLCSLPIKIRMMKSRMMIWTGRIALMGRREMHIGYWWESQKKRPLGRPRRRWALNVKINFKGIGKVGMDWIHLAQDGVQWKALVNTVMNLRVPYYFGKFLSSCTTGGFSRIAQFHEVSSVASR